MGFFFSSRPAEPIRQRAEASAGKASSSTSVGDEQAPVPGNVVGGLQSDGTNTGTLSTSAKQAAEPEQQHVPFPIETRIIKPTSFVNLDLPDSKTNRLTFGMEILNTTASEIPQGSVIRIASTPGTYPAFFRLAKAIPVDTWLDGQDKVVMEVRLREGATFLSLPAFLQAELENISTGCKTRLNNIPMDCGYFLGSLKSASSTSTSIVYNAVHMGEAGNGKSTSINSFKTTLNAGQVMLASAVTGSGTGHVTKHLDRIQEVENTAISFWDTTGMTIENQTYPDLENIILGKLPIGQEIRTIAPAASEQKLLTEKEALLSDDDKERERINQQQRRIHAVLFFVAWGSFADEPASTRTPRAPSSQPDSGSPIALYRSAIERLLALGHNPLIVLSHVDELDPDMRKHPSKPSEKLLKKLELVSKKLQVPPIRVTYIVNYIKEDKREFGMDQQICHIMSQTLKICKEYCERTGTTPASIVKSASGLASTSGPALRSASGPTSALQLEADLHC